MIVFVGGGMWFFSGRLPHDVTMRLELPTFVQTHEGRLDRGDMGHFAGTMYDSNMVEVANFTMEQHWAGEAPLSKPVALRLRSGTYRVAVKVDRNARAFVLRDPELAPELVGIAKIGGPGEVRVDVRSTFERGL